MTLLCETDSRPVNAHEPHDGPLDDFQNQDVPAGRLVKTDRDVVVVARGPHVLDGAADVEPTGQASGLDPGSADHILGHDTHRAARHQGIDANQTGGRGSWARGRQWGQQGEQQPRKERPFRRSESFALVSYHVLLGEAAPSARALSVLRDVGFDFVAGTELGHEELLGQRFLEGNAGSLS